MFQESSYIQPIQIYFFSIIFTLRLSLGSKEMESHSEYQQILRTLLQGEFTPLALILNV